MPRHSADPPILLVEDKDSLRAMMRLALEAQGHLVVEARDQPEAVRRFDPAVPASSCPTSASHKATDSACFAPPRSSILSFPSS